MLLAIGIAWPFELYDSEYGPALKFASHIIISLTFDPPGVFDVKRSYATFETTLPDEVCDHDQAA